MKAPEVIIPVVAVLVALRIGLRLRRIRRRRTAADVSPVTAGGRWSGGSLGGDTGLIAAREIRERLRGRIFKVVTIILLVVVAAAIVIPTLTSSTPSTLKVAVVGTLPPGAHRALVGDARRAGYTVRISEAADLSSAKHALSAGHLTAVIDGTRRVLVRTATSASGTTTTGGLAHVVAQVVGFYAAAAAATLTPAQADTIAHAHAVTVASLRPATAKKSAGTPSVVGLILTFVMLTQYLGWTLMGVLEEKTSRVVEVLLAAVRPVQLLGGKVLGIGVMALGQAVLVVGFALALGAAVGSDLLHGTGPAVVLVSLLWLVLGYAFYSWVYAAAGSMASRQDQVQSLAVPLSIPILVGYIVCLSSAGQPSPTTLVEVLAYFPPTAMFGMPVLVGYGTATWWEFLLSVALMLASTVLVARLAAGVYRRAVLQTARRVTVRELFAGGR